MQRQQRVLGQTMNALKVGGTVEMGKELIGQITKTHSGNLLFTETARAVHGCWPDTAHRQDVLIDRHCVRMRNATTPTWCGH